MSLQSLKFFPACIVLLLSFAVEAADTNALTEASHVRLGSGQSLSSPAIATDGTIYQGTFDGRMLAISPQGKVLWAYRTEREIKSSPAIGDDGTIYFGTRGRKLYALTPMGKLKWMFS